MWFLSRKHPKAMKRLRRLSFRDTWIWSVKKKKDCNLDMDKEGLRLYVDGDFMKAEGTTLGGDDGIAVAYALAILESDEISHPKLEVVITVDEEIGMLGAAVMDLSMLTGHTMLNIDSDEEGIFLTGCAGGMALNVSIPVTRVRQTRIEIKEKWNREYEVLSIPSMTKVIFICATCQTACSI